MFWKHERPTLLLGRSHLRPADGRAFLPETVLGRLGRGLAQWTVIGTFLVVKPFGAFIVTSSTPSW
jgi:hypothetical protein